MVKCGTWEFGLVSGALEVGDGGAVEGPEGGEGAAGVPEDNGTQDRARRQGRMDSNPGGGPTNEHPPRRPSP